MSTDNPENPSKAPSSTPSVDEPDVQTAEVRAPLETSDAQPDPLGMVSAVRKWGRRFLWMGSILFFLIVLYAVRGILLPFILAVVVAYVVSPLVDRMSAWRIKKMRLPRWISVILIYIILLIGVYVFSLLVLPRFASEFSKMANDVPTIFRKASQVWVPDLNDRLQSFLQDLKRPLEEESDQDPDDSVNKKVPSPLPTKRPIVLGPEDIGVEEMQVDLQPGSEFAPEGDVPDDPLAGPLLDQLAAKLENYSIEVEQKGEGSYKLQLVPLDTIPNPGGERALDLQSRVQQKLDNLLSSGERLVADAFVLGRNVVGMVVGSLMTLVLTFMLAAFILIDTPRIKEFFRSLTPPKYREEYDDVVRGIDRGLGGVIRGQLMICLVNGTLTGIGLTIIGVKYAVVLAVIAAVFSLIPIFGTILSTIPAVAIGLTQSFMIGFLALVWIVIIHLIEANILNPKIMGSSAHIHPVLVVFALVAGEYGYGLFGALLAVPVFSIFQTLFLYFRQKAYPE